MEEIYRNDGMILKSDFEGKFIVTCSASDTIYTAGTKKDVIDFLKKEIEIYGSLVSDVAQFITKTSREMLEYIK